MTVMFSLTLEAGSKIKIYQMQGITGKIKKKKENTFQICVYYSNLRYYLDQQLALDMTGMKENIGSAICK